MEILSTLGVALGLGSLAGLNLYLTVFVTGLALRMDWVTLPPALNDLSVLSDPVIIGIAGFLYIMEFFADKIPWIDTAWDAVHTFIRPVGAAALAVAAMGEAHPAFAVAAGLLAGGMALTSHVAKAGTRLVANTSPEPFSNIGLSLAEDGIVVAGLGLLVWNPIVALVVALAFTALVITFAPRLLRGIRAKLWFAWKKLNAVPEDALATNPGDRLPSSHELHLRRAHASTAPVRWAVPCLSGGGPRLIPNLRGWLVGLSGEPSGVFFVGRSFLGAVVLEMDVTDASVSHRSGFLCDKVEIVHRDGAPKHAFLFERSLSKIASALPGIIQSAEVKPEDPA